MALATQCPHCHTTFKVAHDQLKLRAGLVRCGACQQIFNGIENLRPDQLPVAPPTGPTMPADPAARIDTAPAVPTPVDAPTPSMHVASEPEAPNIEPQREDELARDASLETVPDGPEPEPPAVIASASGFDDTSATAPEPLPEPPPEPVRHKTVLDIRPTMDRPSPPFWQGKEEDEEEKNTDDMQAEVDPAATGTQPGDAAPVSAGDVVLDTKSNFDNDAGDDNQAAAPGVTTDIESETDVDAEPSFVIQGKRRQRFAPLWRAASAGLVVLLSLLLLGQTAYLLREQIAARIPQAKSLLDDGCRLLGCRVGLPMQIEMVAIESGELVLLDAQQNAYAFTGLLRNQSESIQAWPALELSLNDANEKPLVRKAFMPSEYLPADRDPRAGFPARSEQSIRLAFALADIKPSGYRVYLFYP